MRRPRLDVALLVVTVGLVAVALAIVLLGGSDDRRAAPKRAAAPAGRPSPTVEDVRRRFRELAGVDLRVAWSGPVTRLEVGFAAPTNAVRRYGSFALFVARGRDGLAELGAYGASGPSERVANVVLLSGPEEDIERPDLPTRLLRTLGTPVDAVRLPAADTACARAGIDPAGGTGPAGTCRLGLQTVRVVPGRTATVPEARVTALGVVRRGRDVLVRLRATPRTSDPLWALRPRLVLGGRTSRPASAPISVKALGGARTMEAVYRFPDVPQAAGDPRRGALELSDDPETTYLSLALDVARVRLASVP